MKDKKISKSIYGKISQIKSEVKPWGSIRTLFKNWDKLNLNGYSISFQREVSYKEWALTNSENLCVVEKGKGRSVFNGKDYLVQEGDAFKIFPKQEPVIIPNGNLKIISVQKPDCKINEIQEEDFDILKVINPENVPAIVYEYESLGQEIMPCKYENGLGLIRFVFAIDKIPLHTHPNAGRLIRTISGKGYTYLDPNKYSMDEDTFTLFREGTIHTNGPVSGNIYTVWAFQLPWVEPEVTEENTKGSKEFVNYLGFSLPRELWKTKEDFDRAINILSKHGGKENGN
jgi:quercetin dioxygenase-like cupin family protein